MSLFQSLRVCQIFYCLPCVSVTVLKSLFSSNRLGPYSLRCFPIKVPIRVCHILYCLPCVPVPVPTSLSHPLRFVLCPCSSPYEFVTSFTVCAVSLFQSLLVCHILYSLCCVPVPVPTSLSHLLLFAMCPYQSPYTSLSHPLRFALCPCSIPYKFVTYFTVFPVSL